MIFLDGNKLNFLQFSPEMLVFVTKLECQISEISRSEKVSLASSLKEGAGPMGYSTDEERLSTVFRQWNAPQNDKSEEELEADKVFRHLYSLADDAGLLPQQTQAEERNLFISTKLF